MVLGHCLTVNSLNREGLADFWVFFQLRQMILPKIQVLLKQEGTDWEPPR